MSEFSFGVCKEKPTLAQAKRRDKICTEEGGYGYTECNRKRGASPQINDGDYMGWYSGPNMGSPFDDRLAHKVLDRVDEEERKSR